LQGGDGLGHQGSNRAAISESKYQKGSLVSGGRRQPGLSGSRGAQRRGSLGALPSARGGGPSPAPHRAGPATMSACSGGGQVLHTHPGRPHGGTRPALSGESGHQPGQEQGLSCLGRGPEVGSGLTHRSTAATNRPLQRAKTPVLKHLTVYC